MIEPIKTNINSCRVSNKSVYNGGLEFTNLNTSYKSKYNSNYRLPDLSVSFCDFVGKESISTYNDILLKNINNAGMGTREGVVAAATGLVDIFTDLGVKLPYISSTGLSGIGSGKYSKLGIDSNWGTSGKWYSNNFDKYYYKNGLDCSGFISWAIHNGGYKYKECHSSQFEALGNKREFDSNGKPGDIVYKDGHVALIVGVDDTGYTLLHETENDEFNKNMEGLIYTHTDFSGNDYETNKHFTHIIDMSKFYNDKSNLDN